MNGIKKMLLGITILVASVILFLVYPKDNYALVLAIIGLCVSIYGYVRKD